MIGERLAEIRKDHNDTQEHLASKLHISVSTVRSWEQEKSAPCNEMLVNICRLYHITSDYLLGLANEDPTYRKNRRKERFSQEDLEELEEAIALQDISHMPARVKCAVLGWHTMEEMLKKQE